MITLKKLRWTPSKSSGVIKSAKSPAHGYYVNQTEKTGTFNVGYYPNGGKKGVSFATGFPDTEHAVKWANDHFKEKMMPFVEPDSLARIENWFKIAKPKPTLEDLSVQIGCHIEEFAELLQGFGLDYANYSSVVDLAERFKDKDAFAINKLKRLTYEQRIEIADAIADSNVTGVGVLYMLGGIDILGVQNEVIRSNDSKFVNGKAITDERGKISKPETFSPADLKPFVK